ncbi:MAG: endonuclease/exonuclease/phosphatase family protein [Burkholderiales bacterium]
MTELLHIATFNIHKGFSRFNRRMTVHDLREKLTSLGAHVVFLQEVQGSHDRRAERHHNWPSAPQHEFLAGDLWTDFAYGKNAVYDEGHHGNAILSQYPITKWENEDVSAHWFESRGLLHCELAMPGWDEPLHCVCVHLGLGGRGRREQLESLCERIDRLVPHSAPLVIAGDFNDWRLKASKILKSKLDVREAFETANGHPALSYPAGMPIFSLDRIYVRGFVVKSANSLKGRNWSRLSDHVALATTLVRK